MRTLKIEKYIDNQLDESFTVPLAFIRVLNTLLPDAAIESLNQKGFDLNAMVESSTQNRPYQAETRVQEKGIDKKIIITLL